MCWYPLLETPLELGFLGISVDDKTLKYQLEKSNKLDYLNLTYHKAIINRELPYTIGGKLSQSHLFMFLLGKMHIGEVQHSIWSEEILNETKNKNIELL